MELRVLGQLELCIDNRSVPIRAAQQRGVLALLVLERGRSASTDWLIDRLWQDMPPPSAKVTLQSCVYRLRKALDSFDASIQLHTRGNGYLLDAPPGALDLDEFEQAAARGREAMEQGQPGEAVLAFRAGLALWRGEAFEDIDLPAVREYADRLRERRLDVLEQCLAAELAHGRHAEAVAELDELTGRYPLREPFWRLRMLALTKAGHRADAIETYLELSSLLDDELGIEPSTPVRELYEQILAGDPAPAAAPPGVPRMLPAAVGGFTGRKTQLARLDELLPLDAADRPEAVVISAISGTAGIGKTMLAVHWAHRVAARFPDGQLYVNLRGFHPSGRPMPPAEAVRGFLTALGVASDRIPAELDAQVGLYRSLLADRRILVVLDNARDSEQVRPLLPGAPGCLAVVTSRNQLTSLIGVEAARPLLLDLLTTDEARELLSRRLGSERVDAEPRAVDAIIAACVRLPLALVIVAARAQADPQLSLRALAEELVEAGGLDAFANVRGGVGTDVRAVFSWSYRQLSPESARLFRLLGVHPGPDISAPAAASLAGLPASRTRPLLAELTRTHLLTEHRPGRYTFHDLLRAYATELAATVESDAERSEATHRLLDHYLHTGCAAAYLIEPARNPIPLAPPRPAVVPETLADQEQAVDWLTAEDSVLIAAVHLAVQAGFDVHAWQLVWSFAIMHDRQGRWTEVIALFQLALDAATRAGDPLGQAHQCCGLGAIYTRLGDYGDARPVLERGAELFAGAGDQNGEGHCHYILSAVLSRLDQVEAGIAHAERAAELFRLSGQQVMQARALEWLGWAYAEQARYEQAFHICHRALDIQEERGDRSGQASTLDTLGYVHHLLEEYDRAEACYRQSIELNHELNDRYHEASTMSRLGDTHLAAGSSTSAAEAWRAALRIMEELGHRHAEDVRARLAGLSRP